MANFIIRESKINRLSSTYNVSKKALRAEIEQADEAFMQLLYGVNKAVKAESKKMVLKKF